MDPIVLKVMERYICSNEVTSVIRKEKGEYCVRSPNNPDWNGGCFPSKGKAEARLRQVEYFKHKGSSCNQSKESGMLTKSMSDIADKVAKRFIAESSNKARVEAALPELADYVSKYAGTPYEASATGDDEMVYIKILPKEYHSIEWEIQAKISFVAAGMDPGKVVCVTSAGRKGMHDRKDRSRLNNLTLDEVLVPKKMLAWVPKLFKK
jgi:hypothetical protein